MQAYVKIHHCYNNYGYIKEHCSHFILFSPSFCSHVSLDTLSLSLSLSLYIYIYEDHKKIMKIDYLNKI